VARKARADAFQSRFSARINVALKTVGISLTEWPAGGRDGEGIGGEEALPACEEDAVLARIARRDIDSDSAPRAGERDGSIDGSIERDRKRKEEGTSAGPGVSAGSRGRRRAEGRIRRARISAEKGALVPSYAAGSGKFRYGAGRGGKGREGSASRRNGTVDASGMRLRLR